MGEILGELVSDAVKYSDPGKAFKKIVIRYENGVLSASDNGIGIQDAAKVWEAGYRENRAVAVEGTGKGLSFVQEKVRAIGAEIKFVSSPGEGTTFFLTLNAKYIERR